MNRMLLKVIFIFIVFFPFVQARAQGKYITDTYQADTLRLTQKSFSKTVAYQYHFIVFYLDYNSFKQVVVDRLEGYQLHTKSTYEATLKKLNVDITKSDTVWLSQSTFDSVEIIPFDRYLIQQIETNNCVIKDLNNQIQTEIIRVKEIKYYHPGIWGGRTYYLKKDKKFFIRLTDIVS